MYTLQTLVERKFVKLLFDYYSEPPLPLQLLHCTFLYIVPQCMGNPTGQSTGSVVSQSAGLRETVCLIRLAIGHIWINVGQQMTRFQQKWLFGATYLFFASVKNRFRVDVRKIDVLQFFLDLYKTQHSAWPCIRMTRTTTEMDLTVYLFIF